MDKPKKEHKGKLPFAQRHPKINFLLGLAILLIALVLVVIFVFWLIKTIGNGISDVLDWGKDKLSKLDSVVLVALITGSVSLVGVLFTSVISKIIDYRQKRRDYLNQKREKSYGQFVDMYFKIHENAKGIAKYSEADMVKDMFDFSRELTLWGSNRVVKKWIDFRLNGNKQDNEGVYRIENILFEMRKDFGFKKMKKGTLLKMIVNDYDDYVKNKNNSHKT